MRKRKKYQSEGILDYDVWNEEFNQEFGGQVAPTAELSTVPEPFKQTNFNVLDAVIASDPEPRAAAHSAQSGTRQMSPLHGATFNVPDYDSYQNYIDRPFSFISDDPDDMRAHNQTFGEKALYGMTKLATRTGTNILGSTVGLVYGGASFISDLFNPEESAWKSFWDNDFQRGLDGINDWMDGNLPHYYTKEEQQYNFFRSMGTSNFWFNDFTQGASFVMGAVMSEALMRGLGSSAAVQKLNQLLRKPFSKAKYADPGKMTAAQREAAFKNLTTQRQISNVAIRLRQLGTGAMYEAGVEARHNYDRTLESLTQLFKEDNDGRQPNIHEMAGLVDTATKTANAVWAGNVALVGYGNYIMFPKIFGKGYYGTKASLRGSIKTQKGVLPRGTKRTYKNIRDDYGKYEGWLRNTARVLKVPLYEGFVEEGGQKVLDLAGHHAAESFYLYKADPTYKMAIGELMNSMDDVWAKAYGSKEGQKEIGIGFLLALLGVPGYSHAANKGKGGWTWVGGAMQRHSEHLKEQDQINKLIEVFKKNPHIWDATEANFNALVRAEVLKEIKDASLVINSPYQFKNQEDNEMLNLILKKLQAGLDFTLYEDIQYIRNMRLDKFKEIFDWMDIADLTDDQLKTKRNGVADLFEQKIEEVKEMYNLASTTFTNFGPDQLFSVVEAMAVPKDSDARMEAMHKKAREKMGGNIELEIEVENVSTENENEQTSLLDRLRNIWSRLTTQQKDDINKSPEGKKTKAKLGINSFTKASHVEELFLTIVEETEALNEEIKKVEGDQTLSKKQREKKLKSLELKKEALLKRGVDLNKAIKEGLDPDLSSQEQEILDKWKKQDPAGYEQNSAEVIQLLKDMRLLRARSHRATDMLNYLKAEHNLALRENSTWSKVGKHLPRPEILRQRMIGYQTDLSKNIKDSKLKKLYDRYAGSFIEFTYTRSSEISIGDYKRHAAENDLLDAVTAIAEMKKQSGTISEQDAWKEALEEKGIPYKHEAKTYRVFIKKDSSATDTSKVLVIYPDKLTIDLMREKEMLEELLEQDPKNSVAQEQLAEIENKLNVIGTKPQIRTLDWLKNINNIKRVDRNIVIKEQLDQILQASEEDLLKSIDTQNEAITALQKQIKEILADIKNYRKAEREYKKSAKTDKGNLYIKIPGKQGRGFTAKGLANRIKEFQQLVKEKQLEIEALAIRVKRSDKRLKDFFKLKDDLVDVNEYDDFAETVQEYFDKRWKGDKLMLEQLRNTDAFMNNPIIKGIWKDLDPADDQTDLIDVITNMVVTNQQPAEEELEIIHQAQIELHQRLETLKAAAQELSKQITFKKDGTFSLRGKVKEASTRAEYESFMAEVAEIEAAIELLNSDKIVESFAGAQTVLETRVQRWQRHIALKNVLDSNFETILGIINNLMGMEQDVIDPTLNPYSINGDMTQDEFEEAIEEANKNLKKGQHSKAYTNSVPIHIHGFKKTIGNHIFAMKRRDELEGKESLTAQEERELAAMRAQLRFFYITQMMRYKKNKNELLRKDELTFEDYGIAFVHRGMFAKDNESNLEKEWLSIIQSENAFLFYDKKAGNYKDARGKGWGRTLGTKVKNQEDEHILAVIVDKKTGLPLLEEGLPVYTGIMTAELTEEVVDVTGKKHNITRGQRTDLKKGAKKVMVKRKGERIAKEAWVGEHIPSVQVLAKEHATFRQEILALTSPKATDISGKSHGLTHFPIGENVRHKAASTLVANEDQVKDIQLGISTDKIGNKITVGKREYTVRAGFAFIDHNDNIYKVSVDKLNDFYADQVYQMLRLYARNYFNDKISLENKNKFIAVSEDGTQQILSEKTITQQLSDIIYFGYHTKNREQKPYRIYFENDKLIFGDNSIDLVELNDPEAFAAAHSALKIHIGNMYHQINGHNINKDYAARVTVSNKNNAKWVKWDEKRKLAQKKGGWTYQKLNSAVGTEKDRLWKLHNKWMKANPEPKAAFKPYEQFEEVMVDENLGITSRKWANYTEFLLSQGKKNSPNERTLDQIPIKLNVTPNAGNLKGDLKHMSTPKIGVYLNFGKAKVVSALKNLKSLNTSSTTTVVQESDPTAALIPNSGVQVGQTYEYKAATGQKLKVTINAINSDQTLDISIEKQTLNGKQVEVYYEPSGEMKAVGAKFRALLTGTDPDGVFIKDKGLLWTLTAEVGLVHIPTILPPANPAETQESPFPDNTSSNKKGKSMSKISIQIRDDHQVMDYNEEYEKFKAMVPKDAKGQPIFSVSRVRNLLGGTTHGYWNGISDILLDLEAQRGALYHETWHAIEDRLLSPEEISKVRAEVRNIKGKTSLFGDAIKMASLTDEQISEWMAEEFRHYVLNEGNYKIGSNVQKSLLRRMFEFIFKFLSNINVSQDLFRKIHTGYYGFSEEIYTLFEPKTGKAMTRSRVNGAVEKKLVDSMTVELFEILGARNISISELLQMNETDLSFTLYEAYGSKAAFDESVANGSPDSNTVWAQMMHSLRGEVEEINTYLQETKNLHPDYIAQEENRKQDFINIAVNLNNPGYWEKLKKRNLKNLIELQVNVNLADVLNLEEMENLEEHEEISKDKVASVDPNKINPIKLLAPEIKILLKTLPVGNFSNNIAGTSALAHYGDIIRNLYQNLANKDSLFHMWNALDELAQEDPTYAVLRDRLKLEDYSAGFDNLDKTEMALVVAFFTGFNKASDSYVTQLISKEGGRHFVNSNSNLIENLTMQRWKENFQNNLFRKNLGALNTEGIYVLNTSANLNILGTTKKVEEWFKGKKSQEEMIALLSELGIEFSNLPNVLELLESPVANKEFMEAASRIFTEFTTLDNIINIFEDGGVFGRIKSLVTIERLTTLKTVTLQHPNVNGDLVYGITKKHYINKLADKLNKSDSEVESLLQFENLKNSIYLKRIEEGANLEIRINEGIRNRNDKRGHDISKTIKSNIANLHVNSILEGYVPLIVTGNKKTSRALKVGDTVIRDYGYAPDALVHHQLHVNGQALVDILKGYFIDEIMTARAIQHGDKAKRIKGLFKNNKAELQWFKHISSLNDLAHPHIVTLNFDLDKLKFELNTMNSVFEQMIQKSIVDTSKALEKYHIIDINKEGDVYNRGIDNQMLSNLAKEFKQFTNEDINVKTNKLDPRLAQLLFQKIAITQLIGVFEQSKLVFGNLNLYNDLFKRTSLTVGTKDYPFADQHVLSWMNANMPNLINPGKLHTDKLTTVTRAEFTQGSVYLNSYVKLLEALNRTDLIPAVVGAFSKMDIFDGGGFIHLDTYRRVLYLTRNWGDQQEAVYQKLANNEQLTVDDIGHLPPIKPQVFADLELDGINLKKGDKFALYPVHPQLSKTLSTLDNGQRTVMDDIYEEMNNHGLDYITFESSTKVGALQNKNGFDPILDNETRVFMPLQDENAFVTYNLKDFGIQVDPKFKFSKSVAAPTQGTSLLPSDIYSNGTINPLYANQEFREGMSFEQAINYYHHLNTEIIKKDVNSLARKLGFIESGGTFKLVRKTNKKAIERAILDELQRRELAFHTRQAIIALFNDVDMSLINQLSEKNRIENILYSIVNNTVIRRKMNGEMSVIQSSMGYELSLQNEGGVFATIEQVKKEGIDLTPLKFYSKGIEQLPTETTEEFWDRASKENTLAMEVYLPYAFKAFLGDQFKPGAKIDPAALEILGFRIPTEGLNSIEFMIVKDFLPPQGGSRIIVPNEMVAKAGADFDIDKLTMFFPNLQYNEATNTIEKVKPIESIKELRNADANAYISAAVELFKQANDQQGILKFVNDFNRIKNEVAEENREAEYEVLDKELINMGFYSLLVEEKMQSTAVLQNRLQSFIKDMLAHPLSFDQLISPVGAFGVKTIADQIQALKIENGTAQGNIIRRQDGSIEMITETDNIFDKLGIEGLVETSYQMWSTLGGTGIVASSITNYIKGQRAGLAINPEYEFNFEGFEKGITSISNVYDKVGERISNSMRQYITAYVDGEKDPFIMNVNGGKAAAGVHMLLLRAGVPLKTVLYFMSQPIISEYLERTNLQKGEHTKMFGSKKQLYREQDIINRLLADYVAEDLITPVKFYTNQNDNDGLLESMVAKTREAGNVNSMDEVERAMQKQIFRDFLRYKEIAEDLRKLQVITSFDTARFRNGNEVIQMTALQQMVAQKNVFINAHNMIWGTLLQPLSETVNEFGPGIMSELDLKYTKTKEGDLPFIDKMVQMATEELNQGTTSEAVQYLLEQFDNHITAYVLHQTATANSSWTNHMGDRLQSLFTGANSLAKRIREIQTSNSDLRLNGFIASLRPVISPYQNNSSYEYTIDSITMREKQLTVEDLDVLAIEFQEIQQTDPELAKDIIIYSLLKSGISFSPTSFFEAIPGTAINEMTKTILRNVKEFIKVGSFTQKIEQIYQNFLDNKWNDRKITNSLWHSSVPKWNEDSKFTTEINYGPRVTIVKPYSSSQKGIVKKSKYLNFFYKRVDSKEQTTTDVKNNISTTLYTYELQPAKGVRNELIETHEGLSIHNANNEARPTVELQVMSSTVENISKGSQVLLTRPINASRLRSGKYELWSKDSKDKILVRLEEVGSFNIKMLKKNNKFNIFGVKKEEDIYKVLAKKLGYKSELEMKNSKAMGNFTKNYMKVFYEVKPIAQSNTTTIGESAPTTIPSPGTLTAEEKGQMQGNINTLNNLC